LPKTRNCLPYLGRYFPHLSEAKPKEGIFVGADTRKLIFDEELLRNITEVERKA
jgi:hypothetical protein